MSKINYRRKEWKVKIRIPVAMKPGKIIDPDNLYDRTKEKKRWKNEVEKWIKK